MSPSTPLGRFCWYELLTTDPDAAREFYPAVTGWRPEVWEGGDAPYTMWMKGDAPVGGVMELPREARDAGAPPHWLPYVATPDCDGTLDDVRQAGGAVLWGPMDIPEVGRVVGFSDPHGAVMALHQPLEGNEAPAGDPDEAGAFSWHELASDDWKESRSFYGTVLGWSDAGQFDMGPEMGIYRMFADRPGASEEQAVGGMFDRGESIPFPSWILYVRVGDLERALAAVEGGGGTVAHGPMEVPGGDRVAQCVDPQGAVFALHTSGE